METANNGFYPKTATARKLLVVDLGFLGDSVHLIPALWELKRHYAQADLHVLSAPVGAEIIRLAPCVNRAWVFPLTPESPPWWRHWDILRDLRREKFDLALNFSGADRTIFITALTGARWRLAHLGARDHFWKSWLIPYWISRRDANLPVYEQRRQVLAACGMDLQPARFDLQLPPASVRWAEENIPSGAIHLSINASTHLKEWPLGHWIALAKMLLGSSNSCRLVISASAKPRERDRVNTLAKTINHPGLILTPPNLTVSQLAGALSRCRLHIGVDSGVLHLAMALGIPTISIFRQYAGLNEWLPRGESHRCLSVPCPCADQKNPPCQNAESAACLAQITPEKVALLVRDQLVRDVILINVKAGEIVL